MAAEAASLSPDEVIKLKEFHAAHFRGQTIPSISAGQHGVPDEPASPADDGLGYYADGVKRTLTDDQVKMFRHSEIQRLLARRRQAHREAEEAKERLERRAEDRTRKQHFDDDRATQQDSVQSLTYDDIPADRSTEPPPQTMTQNKQFLWPALGQSR